MNQRLEVQFFIHCIIYLNKFNNKNLIMLSCYSDMVDEKRKIRNYFQNTSYESKLSKVV